MAEAVIRSKAVLGLLVDGSGEAPSSSTKRSGAPRGEALAPAHLGPGQDWKGHAGRWVVPVSASQSVDHLAKKYGGSVLRTPNTARAVLQAAGRGVKEDLALLHPAFDALSFVAVLIQLIKGEGRPLSQLEAAIPAPRRLEVEVPCAWEDKGKVMHTLLERTAGQERDLVDGIKVFHEQSWAWCSPMERSLWCGWLPKLPLKKKPMPWPRCTRVKS